MKKINPIAIVVLLLLSISSISCEKDPDFVKGQYLYQNQELICLNELLIQWSSDDISEDVKDAVREIVATMVLVQGGTFTMGTDDEYSSPDEQPVHKVTLSDYYLANVTVTQKQWAAIMGDNTLWDESYGKGDGYPANFISFEEVNHFIQKLNEYSGLRFRLPTESEWEYAACGGRHSQGFLYSGSNVPDEVAWHRGNADYKMHLSALLRPNELGLYDMSGNVWEWCSDYYGSYSTDDVTNPTGPATGTKRVVRGGSFTYDADYARCKARNCIAETNHSLAVGLRLAISKNE